MHTHTPSHSQAAQAQSNECSHALPPTRPPPPWRPRPLPALPAFWQAPARACPARSATPPRYVLGHPPKCHSPLFVGRLLTVLCVCPPQALQGPPASLLPSLPSINRASATSACPANGTCGEGGGHRREEGTRGENGLCCRGSPVRRSKRWAREGGGKGPTHHTTSPGLYCQGTA